MTCGGIPYDAIATNCCSELEARQDRRSDEARPGDALADARASGVEGRSRYKTSPRNGFGIAPSRSRNRRAADRDRHSAAAGCVDPGGSRAADVSSGVDDKLRGMYPPVHPAHARGDGRRVHTSRNPTHCWRASPARDRQRASRLSHAFEESAPGAAFDWHNAPCGTELSITLSRDARVHHARWPHVRAATGRRARDVGGRLPDTGHRRRLRDDAAVAARVRRSRSTLRQAPTLALRPLHAGRDCHDPSAPSAAIIDPRSAEVPPTSPCSL